MACYVSSNNERLYAAIEPSYGAAASITAADRVPAVTFRARQQQDRVVRRDKTGTRTFRGLPGSVRRQTSFELTTYLTSWGVQGEPGAGRFLEGALGGSAEVFAGGTCGSGCTVSEISFTSTHGLEVGQALTVNSEIRFVAAVTSPTRVILNQSLSGAPSVGSTIGATRTYRPAEQVPSLSVFDYWSPDTALQRVLTGAAVNRAAIRVNGDFHEMEFSGPARDVIDSVSFEAGSAALTEFPAEPQIADFDYSVVPGHLGQAWLGSIPSRFHTLLSAEVTIENGIEIRDREFGGGATGCVSAGERTVGFEFSLFERDDEATLSLYQAARQQSPISVLLQLGQQPGQMLGIWLTGVVPEIPDFDDRENRVLWKFNSSRAQGTANDEIFVAFG